MRRGRPCKGYGYKHICLGSLDGWAIPLWEAQFTCNCESSEEAAIGRLLIKYEPAIQRAKRLYLDILGDLPSIPLRPLSFEEIVEKYSGMKKRRYKNAEESLLAEPLTTRDDRLKVFAKVEPFNPEKGKSKARVILYRSYRFALSMMRFTKQLESYTRALRLPKRNSPGSDPVFLRGRPQAKQAAMIRRKWELMSNPVSFSIDCKKFDAHVQRWQLEANHRYYNRFFGDVEFANLLRRTLSLKFRSARGTEFDVSGRRATGEVTTSIGNNLICYIMARYAMRRLKIRRYELSVDGDNLLLFIEKTDAAKFASWPWEELGHEIEFERTEDFSKIEICQSQLVHTVNGWTLVRDPRKVLSTLAMGHVYGMNKGGDRYAATVARTAALMHAGTPLLGPIIATIADKFTAKDLPLDPWERSLRLNEQGKSSKITPAARESFWRSFGITPDMQVHHEACAMNWEPGGDWATKYQFVSVGAEGELLRVEP